MDAAIASASRTLGVFCGLLLLALIAMGLALAVAPMIRDRDRRFGIALTLLVTVMIVKFALLPVLPGNITDLVQFEAWGEAMARFGPAHVYDPQFVCKYTPAYLYALWAAAAMAPSSPDGLRTAVESPLLIADLLLGVTVYAAARRTGPARLALPATLLLAFNPALIYASAGWGQNDCALAFPVLLSALMAVESRYAIAWALAVVAALIKAQGLMLLPILAWWTLTTGKFSDWIKSAGAALATALVVIAPFQLARPWHFIFDSYTSSLGFFPWASVNAFNLMLALGGLVVPDSDKVVGPISFFLLGNFLFGLAYVAAAWIVWRQRSAWGLLYSVFLLYLAMFIFLPRMHERYLYYAVAFLAPIMLTSWAMFGLYVTLTVTLFLDMVYVFFELVYVRGVVEGHLLIGPFGRLAISLVNVAALLLATGYGLAVASATKERD